MCIFRINGEVFDQPTQYNQWNGSNNQRLASTTERPPPPQLLSVITAGAGEKGAGKKTRHYFL